MFNFTKLHVANKYILAPKTGQSFSYICAHNFWPVGPIFKNKVPLDSLDHADFNAPYDADYIHTNPHKSWQMDFSISTLCARYSQSKSAAKAPI